MGKFVSLVSNFDNIESAMRWQMFRLVAGNNNWHFAVFAATFEYLLKTFTVLIV